MIYKNVLARSIYYIYVFIIYIIVFMDDIRQAKSRAWWSVSGIRFAVIRPAVPAIFAGRRSRETRLFWVAGRLLPALWVEGVNHQDCRRITTGASIGPGSVTRSWGMGFGFWKLGFFPAIVFNTYYINITFNYFISLSFFHFFPAHFPLLGRSFRIWPSESLRLKLMRIIAFFSKP